MALSLGFTAVAHAQSAPAGASDCTITSDDIQAITAAEAESLTAELTARKALLTRVITCAKGDAQTLQTSLQNIQVASDAQALQSQLLGKLSDAMNYYDLELAEVPDSGILSTEAVAAQVLSYRTSSYDPLSLQVSDFILWSENQNLFAAANARLTSAGNLVSFLETAAPGDDLQSDFATAQTLIETANEENQAAKAALLQSAPGDQSLALIMQSLQSLSDAYQEFSEVSGIVQTLLPTAQGS